MIPDKIKPEEKISENYDASDDSLDIQEGEPTLMTIREFAEFKSIFTLNQ